MQGEPVSTTPYSPAASGPEGGIATRHLLLPPEDTEAPARSRRLQELGIGDRAIPEYDEFARQLALGAGGQFAYVNFIDENRQFLAGLYASAPDTLTADVARAVSHVMVSRELPSGLGYCPHVVVRRKALVLDDVRDFPRFAGNPVVDLFGLHSYMGAPLIDRTGMTLGTICVIDQDPRPWGREGLEFIKSMAARMVEGIEQSEDRTGDYGH
jgi:GAF domain-containing protein